MYHSIAAVVKNARLSQPCIQLNLHRGLFDPWTGRFTTEQFSRQALTRHPRVVKLLGTCVEAIIGAVWMDTGGAEGLEAATALVRRFGLIYKTLPRDLQTEVKLAGFRRLDNLRDAARVKLKNTGHIEDVRAAKPRTSPTTRPRLPSSRAARRERLRVRNAQFVQVPADDSTLPTVDTEQEIVPVLPAAGAATKKKKKVKTPHVVELPEWPYESSTPTDTSPALNVVETDDTVNQPVTPG